MSVEEAIGKIQAHWLAVTGIKEAPAAPPESLSNYPFVITYERSGSFESHAASFGDELVTIRSEVHVGGTLLAMTIVKAMAFRDLFLKRLRADPTLSGTVSTINDISWVFGQLTYAGIDDIGYRFEIGVKVHLDATS